MIYNKYFLEFLNTFSCCNYSEIMCIVAAIFWYLVKRSSWHFRGSTVCFKVPEIKYLLWVMRVSIFQYSKICKFTYFIRQSIGKSFSRKFFAQIYILQEIKWSGRTNLYSSLLHSHIDKHWHICQAKGIESSLLKEVGGGTRKFYHYVLKNRSS